MVKMQQLVTLCEKKSHLKSGSCSSSRSRALFVIMPVQLPYFCYGNIDCAAAATATFTLKHEICARKISQIVLQTKS